MEGYKQLGLFLYKIVHNILFLAASVTNSNIFNTIQFLLNARDPLLNSDHLFYNYLWNNQTFGKLLEFSLNAVRRVIFGFTLILTTETLILTTELELLKR